MKIIIEKNVQVQMRDGIKLATDIYRPDDSNARPVLIQRTPYNKDKSTSILSGPEVFEFIQAGYVVVVQDARGRYASEGEFYPFFSEPYDGADTIAWAASQPWSNGKVGMTSGSYVGSVQWLAAREQPEALQALAPGITWSDWYEDNSYKGGAFLLGTSVNWELYSIVREEIRRRMMQGKATNNDIEAAWQVIDNADEIYNKLPLTDIPLFKEFAQNYIDGLEHPASDDYWKFASPNTFYERVMTPCLNYSGWYDIFLAGTIANYTGMKSRGGSEKARRNQRLIIGPWSHESFTGVFPEREYGVRASAKYIGLADIHIRWFDHWLKGIDNGVENDKPVKIFVMGIDQWREEDDWPIPGTKYIPYYLNSKGNANTAFGDGILNINHPSDIEPEDIYIYDPFNPVPTVGGNCLLKGGNAAGPCDQRSIEGRNDILCYTTPVLEQSIEVTGNIKLVLYVLSSAVDTDFTGKLIDVYPDGRSEILSDGILRTRYRNSSSRPELMEPGKVYELQIDMVATSNVFKAGHRIRLEISSSNFPRYNRNSNTGGLIASERPDSYIQAENRIIHNAMYPSHLILPIP